ncbi:hypothetical protein J4410_05335 [Candidatus Woesearchaeota archaeon]|nr:hypothetical protein [Candidatus Woesearchaeota archaeon]
MGSLIKVSTLYLLQEVERLANKGELIHRLAAVDQRRQLPVEVRYTPQVSALRVKGTDLVVVPQGVMDLEIAIDLAASQTEMPQWERALRASFSPVQLPPVRYLSQEALEAIGFTGVVNPYPFDVNERRYFSPEGNVVDGISHVINGGIGTFELKRVKGVMPSHALDCLDNITRIQYQNGRQVKTKEA